MLILNIVLDNLFAIPILCFLFGIIVSATRLNWLFFSKIHSVLTCFLLFCIGLKGGISFIQHSTSQFFSILGIMVAWGLIHPFISYGILRRFTRIDSPTAAAIAACFGSVSLMTFAAGTAFLEKLNIPYQTVVIPILAIMEIPAIFSGLFISQWRGEPSAQHAKNLWIHTFFNKTILMIVLGMVSGICCYPVGLNYMPANILSIFKPCLYLFLFNMGVLIGRQRKDLNQFSWPLSLFGCYMPLIGGAFGILLSYFFDLDPGTGTLLAILSASASYIAVPAAMRIAIPEAKEAIYLPLSLAIAFPFNIVIGIPIYYVTALKFLKN